MSMLLLHHVLVKAHTLVANLAAQVAALKGSSLQQVELSIAWEQMCDSAGVLMLL